MQTMLATTQAWYAIGGSVLLVLVCIAWIFKR